MRKVKVITDSCSDLNVALMEKYNIDYAKMNTVFEGKESPADLSWTPDDVHSFYENMRAGKRFTTTQVPVEEFRTVFTKYLDQGMDIVYISCSIKQTGSINTAIVLSKKLKEEYPDATIKCVDSFNACIGEGAVAIEAAKLAAEGKSADEIEEYVIKIRKTMNEFVTVHTLDYLKRAGRVKATSAFFGNLMGVKPILVADVEGSQAAFKKVKGRQTSIKEIVTLLKNTIKNPEEQTIYLAHADCSEVEVNQLKDLIKQEVPCKEIETLYIGPIIGASVGPDAIGVWAFGEAVTFKGGE
ncbi:MAG: DegV family protein [Treponema sp.]|nr:DegV family protein [Treponema sp.]